jgi:predicted  nucleic acid-binding Zn-ribbon protein
MSNTNEFKKILSAVGALGFGGAGIASLFTAGIAPLAWGSAAFVLAGISGRNLLATDKIDLLEEQNQEIAVQLADLRSRLNHVTTERDDYKRRLENEVAGFKVRCQQLQDGIEYWKSWPPEIMDAPPVRELVNNLRGKLASVAQQLETALAEIENLKAENKILSQKVIELENLNDELDGDLASKLLELAQLKTNFDYKLRDELHSKLQPYCNQAVSVAVEKKLAEIDKLKQAISMLQEDIGNYQQVMDSLEKDTLPEIEKTYKVEMSEADSKLMELAGQNELLQQKIAQLEAPQQFPGITYADSAGNRIINHFVQHGVLFDAHDASVIPGGFCLRFRVSRNADKTKLSGEEFDKLTQQCGLMGISTQPIHFRLDLQNFLISVEVFSGMTPVTGTSPKKNQDVGISSLSTIGGLLTEDLNTVKRGNKSSQQGFRESHVPVAVPDAHRQKFVDLGCYPKDQFHQIIAERFSERVRVVAGSTGGKSPLLEMICLAIAKRFAHTRKAGSIVFFPNPIPGGDKDWFVTPSIVQSGDGGMEAVAGHLEDLLALVIERCGTLASSDDWPFIMLMLDEANYICRYFDRQGELIKNVLQAGSHAYVGGGFSGQGLEITGWSGKSKKAANMLRANDFVVGATQIWIDEAALLHIDKAFTGAKKEELKQQYNQLVALCAELNELENRIAKPLTGGKRKVDVDAYRFALATRPAGDPFFFQIPDYGSELVEGLQFPPGAAVTSRYTEEKSDRLLHAFEACPHCLSTAFRAVKPYADGTTRFECGDSKCRKKFGRS